MTLLKYIVLSIFLVSYFDSSYQNYIPTPVTVTKSGQIVGSVKALKNGHKINEYLGIPYAQPPVGDLRFRKPVPVTPWNKTFQAVKERDSCMQVKKPGPNTPTLKISEDCLFLNIWTPNGKSRTVENQSLPIMFWIHGGGLIRGSIFYGDLYNGSYIASLGDVIVVSTNYRLGPFGFLYGGNDEMPGNVGFYDQLLALKWVRDNIAVFGGDASSITIFGESGGGWSVSNMVMSPLTKGLFKRAIIQSGTTNIVIRSRPKEKSLDYMKFFAKSMNCTGSSLEEFIECLKNKPARDFLRIPDDSDHNAWTIYGDEYLPLKPAEALKQGKLNSVDLLFGHTKNEGSIFIIPFIKDIKVITIDYAKNIIKQIIDDMNLPYGKKVADYYTDGLKDDDKIGLAQAASSSMGDLFVTCPTVLFGSIAARWGINNNVYAYVLAESPTNSFFEKNDTSVIWRGVCHGEDLLYLFGAPLRDGQQWPEKDKELSRNFIEVWTTFAKTGHVPSVGSKSWDEAVERNATQPHVKYMELSRKSRMVEHGYDKTCEGFLKPYIEQ